MKKLLTLFVILIFPVYGFGSNSNARLVLFTVPKSGTHLLEKYFFLLKEIHPRVQSPLIVHFYDPRYPPNFIPPSVKKIQNEGKKIIPIFLIRDLRDIYISALNYASRDWFLSNYPNGVEWIDRLTRPERLMDLVQGTTMFPGALCVVPMYDRSINYLQIFEQAFLEYCLVRFEDLIGPMGGGDYETQLHTIYRLASWSDVDLSPKEAEWIAERLFGKEGAPNSISSTFRTGMIGKWKEEFTEEHKKEFKKRNNWFLVKYGYEEDDNW